MGTVKNIWVPHVRARFVDQTSGDSHRFVESVKEEAENVLQQ